jgi:hypothetical protein
MRRKAWIAIRRGEIMPHFYLSDEELNPMHFYRPEEVQIAGPVNVEAPAPPTDMVGMTRIVWSNVLGYVYLAN